MNAERVKTIVQEEVGAASQATENEIRDRVRTAVRNRTQLSRRIDNMASELRDAETNLAVLDEAIKQAEHGDVSKLPQAPCDVPGPMCNAELRSLHHQNAFGRLIAIG